MKTRFEDIKQSIVEAQLSSTPEDRAINGIMKGSVNLLSANDIINRLGINSEEFLKLVNLPNHYVRANGILDTMESRSRFYGEVELINSELENNADFPKPDLYILGKARWTKETFKKWLEEQFQAKKKAGV